MNDTKAAGNLQPLRLFATHLPGYQIMLVRIHSQLEVKFEGKSSHSGAAPWDGVNALDAAVTAYVNISVLRQQIKPTCRAAGEYYNIDVYLVTIGRPEEGDLLG